MQLAISYAVISLVTLCATIFVALLHLKQARKDVRGLDFRAVSVELLTLTVWVILFTRLLRAETPLEQLGFLILFILSITFGVLLIVSTLRELRTRKAVHSMLVGLEQMNTRLRELDSQKTEFISLASHQLRAPLASLHGHTTMLLEGEYGRVPKTFKEPLEKMLVSSQALSGLINDFLDVARLEKGELEYHIAPCNIIEILDDTVNEFALLFNQAELDCVKTYDPDDRITVLGDKDRIKQVFTKLLDNALKYTLSGGLTISVAIKQHDAIVTIADTGIGVLQEDMPHMFKKFKRAQNASELTVQGSGLGLYAAKEIIEAQGGRIWAQSPGKHKGTRLFVALPLRD